MADKTATAEVLTDLDPQADAPFTIQEGDEILDMIPAAEAAPVAAAEPEAAKPAEPGVPVATHVAERKRRRESEGRWKRIEEAKAKLEGNLSTPQTLITAPLAEFNLGLSPEEMKQIRDKAEKAESFGEVADIVLAEFTPRLQARLNAQSKASQNHMTKQVNDALWALNMSVIENLARQRNPGYDRVIAESGLADGLAVVRDHTGRERAKDEVLAREVFSQRDPAQALFDIASDKLAQEGKLEAVLAAPPVSATGEPEPPAAVPTPAEAAATARAEVLSTTVKNGQRPRGISAVPGAGARPGARQITREQISDMADNNPDAYRALMAKRPDIRVWYLGGVA